MLIEKFVLRGWQQGALKMCYSLVNKQYEEII
jgi:hypothetical protein